MSLVTTDLKYNDSGDGFNWSGSEEELIKLVNSCMDAADDEGDLTPDKTHNAVSYKVKDAGVRLYKTTGRLKLFGSRVVFLQDKLSALLSTASNSEDTVVINLESNSPGSRVANTETPTESAEFVHPETVIDENHHINQSTKPSQ